MNILHVASSLAADQGGPSRSIPGLAAAQGRQGNDVVLACADLEHQISAGAPMKIQAFKRGWPTAIGRSPELARFMRDSLCEVVHHHGLWHRALHYSRQKSRHDNVPLVLAPRGMMMPWAWRHHARRKRFARRFIHHRAFEECHGWHATSRDEADTIKRLGFTQPICIAPNGVNIPTPTERDIAREHWQQREPLLTERRSALFYSRFHSKKRVIECIDLWREVAPPDWLLLMVGIPDQFTAAELSAYALRSGAKDRVRIFDGTKQPPPYCATELLLFPSHSENFGLVVPEALAHGIPAVVTTGSPWEELNSTRSGWWGNWDELAPHLRRMLQHSPEELRAMGEQGCEWVSREYGWDKIAATLTEFYSELRVS